MEPREPRRREAVTAVASTRTAHVVVAVAAVAAVALAWVLSRAGWNPSSDLALVELRVRDVGTRHTPGVGTYSREGWNHPGPILFYLLALPYRLLGSRSGGLLAGALALDLAALGGSLALLRRLGGRVLLAWGALLLALLARALGGAFLVDPWNPRVGVLPLVTLVLCAWWLADGDARALPVGVAIGSFLVQSHLGYAPVVAATLAVGSAAYLLASRRAAQAGADAASAASTVPPMAGADPDHRADAGDSAGPAHPEDARWALLRGAVVAAGVGLILWLPPLLAETTGGGNLRELWAWTFDRAPTAGLSHAWELVSRQLAWDPPWITGREPLDHLTGGVATSGASLPLALLGLGAAAAVAHRRRDRAALHGVVLAATTVAAAVVSVARIRGFVYAYLTQWLWVTGLLCWLAAGWALYRALPARARHTVERFGAPAALVVAAAVALLPGREVADRPIPEPYLSLALGRVATATVDALDPPPGCDRVAVTEEGGSTGYFLLPGFALRLEREGFDVSLDPRWSDQVGPHRTAEPAAAAAPGGCALIFASGAEVEEVAAETGLSPIATYDSHTPAQRAAEEEFLTHFEEVMSTPGIELDDPRVLEIQRRLERRSHLPPVVHIAVYRSR